METCSEKEHIVELEKFCRVCAKKIRKGYKHKCSTSGSILQPFGANVASDRYGVHPSHYCHTCHTIAKRIEKAGGGAESTLQAHTWLAHTHVKCVI